MRRVAVFIGTTGGAVQIERITSETIPRSMVCLQRTSTVLPISNDYNDFVQPGSGIVVRELGLGSDAVFRLDLSDRISTGKSWQLGVFIGHVIAQSDDCVLAASSDTPDEYIWLTGEMDYDLNIRPVEHLAEKFRTLNAAIGDWRASGKPVTVVAPDQDGTAEGMARLAGDGVRCLRFGNAQALLDALDLETPGPALLPVQRPDGESGGAAAGTPPKRQATGRLLALAAGVAVIVGAAVYWNVARVQPAVETAEQDQAAPPPEGANADQPAVPATVVHPYVAERRPPAGDNCAEVHFGRVEAVSNVLAEGADGDVSQSTPGDLCGLAFGVAVDGEARYVLVHAAVSSGRFLDVNGRPSTLAGATPFSGRQEWIVNVPRRLSEPLDYRLFVISGAAPVTAEVQDLSTDAGGADAVARIVSDGYAVHVLAHRVAP